MFTGNRGRDRAMTTRQYARLLTDRVASIGLDPRVFGTHSLRWTKATLIYRHTGNLRAGSSCSATPRSKARCVISASRLTTRSRLPSKLMSESPGQGRHAVRFFANNGLTTTCNYVDLGVVNDVRCGHERRFRPVRRMSASPLPAPDWQMSLNRRLGPKADAHKQARTQRLPQRRRREAWTRRARASPLLCGPSLDVVGCVPNNFVDASRLGKHRHMT